MNEKEKEHNKGKCLRVGPNTHLIALNVGQVKGTGQVLCDCALPATGGSGHKPYMVVLLGTLGGGQCCGTGRGNAVGETIGEDGGWNPGCLG